MRDPRFESRSGHVFFRPCDIWWLSVGPCSGCEQQPERDFSPVPAWFRVDSGTNLIKQGENQMSQGRKKNVARPGHEPRVSRLPCEHSTTELPSQTIDRLRNTFVMYVSFCVKNQSPYLLSFVYTSCAIVSALELHLSSEITHCFVHIKE